MERIKFYLPNAALFPADILQRFLSRRYRLFKWFIIHVPSGVLERWGRANLRRAFLHAKIFVPAYRRFLSEHSMD